MSKVFRSPVTGRALRVAAAGVVVLGLLLWWLLPLGEKPPSGTITFSTGTPRGVYQKYGVLLRAELAKDMPELEVRLKNSDGSQENVARVATGEADFTIAAADAVETYAMDNGPGAGDLRGVARLYDDYVHIVVPRDSDIQSVADLRGKRVAIGPTHSGVRLIATRVLRTEDIDARRDITPLSDGIDTGPGRLKRGEIDAFFWSGGLPTDGLSELAGAFDFRFVPIDAEFVARLHGQGGGAHYYRATNMPESAYETGQTGTVPTMAVSNVLITRADVDPELTEWLTRTVIKSRDGIGDTVHSAQLVDLRTAIYTDPLPLHAGARRYYRSVKP
ncbi:TAXI family TRAP transporter solute-binding subunit [Streptomyces sp. NPDC006610]|jgi:TRAP transporter TAXI family solute receptor|uniref:TAXI family TRAP transporter solute-binding subunit n=1 Tax=Streptomyces sp. NPDC006610 TaxID=3154584 RepID=UPI0033B2DA27